MDDRIAEALREEMIEQFEQVDRRVDEATATVAEQFVEQRAYTDFGYDRIEKALQSLNAGIARIERKLDRILALSVERTRLR